MTVGVIPSHWTPAAEVGVSVVMPAYNASHYLKITLPPLAEMLRAGEILELIVVDDCSTDDTVAVAESFGARVLRMPINSGPGAARNFAVPQTRGDLIWLVDADVVAKPGSPAMIREILSETDTVAVFGAYDETPPAQRFWSQYKNLAHRYYHQGGRREASTFWAGCGAFRREAFLKVGGFDIHRFKIPSIEDIELGYRMRDAGGRIVLEPALQATHLKDWTLRNVIHTDIFCRAMPWSKLMLERGEIGGDLNVGPSERIRAVIAGLFFASFAGLLAAPLFSPWLALAPVVMTAVVLAANAGFFGFMTKVRGLVFALGATAFHQVYYVYSAAVFALCAVQARIRGPLKAGEPKPRLA